MKITYLQCDLCGITNRVKPYRINMGAEMDPSGCGYNANWKYIDLCDGCVEIHNEQKPEERLQPNL